MHLLSSGWLLGHSHQQEQVRRSSGGNGQWLEHQVCQLLQTSAGEEADAIRMLAHVRERCHLTHQLLGGVRPIQEWNDIESHHMTIISINIEELWIYEHYVFNSMALC
jgi:hypothetical protein